MMKQETSIERPYSLLFLFGILSSLTGVGLWIFSLSGFQYWQDPTTVHKLTMFGLFMFSFIEGFILTALPNFTRGKKINSLEYSLILLLKAMQFSGLVTDKIQFMILALILDFFVLLTFLFFQYRTRKANPPATFIFVPVGLMYGLVYLLLEFFYGNYLRFNAALLLEFGFILNIVLGVGAKILPVIMGRLPVAAAFSIEKKKPTVLSHLKEKEHLYFMIALNAAILFQVFFNYFMGSLLIAIFLGASFFIKLKIAERPKNRTLLTLGIWIALWAMLAGTFLSSFEIFAVFGRHIYFIAGLSLLTVMIASRVSLSHGGHGLHFESTSKGLIGVIALGVLSAAIRFVPSVQTVFSYEHALICAAALWISSNILWLIILGKKIYQPG